MLFASKYSQDRLSRRMARAQFAQLAQVRSSQLLFTRVMVAQPEQERFELLVAAALIAHRIGFESDFPSKEFTTTAPFEAFPTGELVALSERKDFALPLKQLFRPADQGSLD